VRAEAVDRGEGLLEAVERSPSFTPDDGCWAELLAGVEERLELLERFEALAGSRGAIYWRSRAAELRAELAPGSPAAWQTLGFARLAVWDREGARAAFERCLELDGDRWSARGSLAYLSLCDRSWVEAVAAHRAWDDRHGDGAALLPRVARDGVKRLRVGYVAHNLSSSPEARFLLPLALRHTRVEVFLYSDTIADAHRAHPGWRPIGDLDEEGIRRTVAADEIDILINADGHLDARTMLAFARRAAPIQAVSPLYPCSSGLRAMDYRISDSYLDQSSAAGHFRERIQYLEGSCLWFAAPEEGPEVEDPPLTRNGFCTFGVFASPLKITDETISVWARVLKAVPGSRLLAHWAIPNAPGGWSGEPDPRLRDLLLTRFLKEGVEPSRVAALGAVPYRDHLDAHNEVDVMLDTFPFTGYTSSFDALWMGVPIVTRSGDCFRERITAAILRGVGHPELAAASNEEYVAICAELSANPRRLTELRRRLRRALQTSGFCDLDRYAARLEEVYAAWVFGGGLAA
jgi:protein O-GlcNAc transferase